jgi:hypothetical protein
MPDEIADACRALIGEAPAAIDPPAGRRRRSFRVLHLGDRTVIATRRRSAARAELEFRVLEALHGRGAPVPAPLAFRDGWLIQDDLGARRLSAAIMAGDAAAWLDRALGALAACHDAAADAGLAGNLATLGARPDWLDRLVHVPQRIGQRIGLPAPTLADAAALAPPRAFFVKWDARPGNAIARDDGSVFWFDWEHCGARDGLDDLAWTLGDEYAVLAPAAEEALIDRYLPRFSAHSAQADPRAYLAAMGTLHMSVRLALILHHKADGSWWDDAVCIADDKVGVMRPTALALCEKAARWAARAPATARLAPWFGRVREHIASL